MAHAEKCPVCKGCGNIPYESDWHPNYPGGDSGGLTTCQSCGGKGRVELADTISPMLEELPSATYEYDYHTGIGWFSERTGQLGYITHTKGGV